MWALTEDQKKLASEYFYVATLTAAKKGNRRDPDSSLSDACIGLCDAAHTWDPSRGLFKTHAYNCCRNAITNGIRYNMRAKRRVTTNVLLYPVPDHKPALLDAMVAKEERSRVNKAATVLTAKEKIVMELYLAGASMKQIGAELGLKRNSAHCTITRGISRIKRRLSK